MRGVWVGDYCDITYDHVTIVLRRISVWVQNLVTYFEAILGYVRPARC
jgi:hypothetical protein